jgi:hypothetical protein
MPPLQQAKLAQNAKLIKIQLIFNTTLITFLKLLTIIIPHLQQFIENHPNDTYSGIG